MKFLIFLFTLSLSSVVLANLHPDAGRFALQAEFLYLQPSDDAVAFATEVTGSNSEKELVNIPNYSPGYRVEGIYALDGLYNLHARFTYFNSGNNRRHVTSRFGFPPTLRTVENNLKFRYYAGELLFGRWCFNDSDFDFELETGILYSNIQYSSATRQSAVAGAARVESKFWGVGPELAVNFKYPLPLHFYGMFAFAVDARFALLYKENQFSEVFFPNFTTDIDTLIGVTPGGDLRFGLNWNYIGNYFIANLELGYEWIFYHGALIDENISFHGPYLAVGTAF